MSAKPRDLLKSRPARLAEVLSHLALKAGHANGQVILDGAAVAVGTTATKFNTTAGEVVLAGAIVAVAATVDNVVDAGSTTGAGEFRKVLVEVDVNGAVAQVVGAKAASQAAAVLPDGDPTRISLGWLEIPASFTPATTNVVAGMVKQMPYNNGSNS